MCTWLPSRRLIINFGIQFALVLALDAVVAPSTGVDVSTTSLIDDEAPVGGHYITTHKNGAIHVHVPVPTHDPAEESLNENETKFLELMQKKGVWPSVWYVFLCCDDILSVTRFVCVSKLVHFDLEEFPCMVVTYM